VAAGQRIGTVGGTNGAVTHPGTTFADGRHDPSGRTLGELDTTRRRASADHLHFEVAPARYPMRSSAPRLDAEAFLSARGLAWDEHGSPRTMGVTLAEVASAPLDARAPQSYARGCAPAAAALFVLAWEVYQWL